MVILSWIVDLAILVIILQAVLTWIPSYPGSSLYPIQSFLTKLVNPIYAPLRRVIPPIRTGSGMGIDIAPMVLMLVLLVIIKPLIQ